MRESLHTMMVHTPYHVEDEILHLCQYFRYFYGVYYV